MTTTTLFTASLFTVLSVPAGLLANNSSLGVASTHEAVALLKDIRSQKREIARRLDLLHRNTSHPALTSWQTQANELDVVRQHINRLTADLRRLEASSAVLAPAQRDAVAGIRSSLVPVVQGVNEVVRKLNENQLVIRTPGYYNMLGAVARQASDSASNVRQSVQMALNSPSVAPVSEVPSL